MISRSVDYAIWIIDEAIARNIRRFILLGLGDPGPDFDQRLLVEVTADQSWMMRAPAETYKLSDTGQTYPVRYASTYIRPSPLLLEIDMFIFWSIRVDVAGNILFTPHLLSII